MDGGREQQAPPEGQPGKNLIKIPSYQEVFGTGASSSSSKPASYNPPLASSGGTAAAAASSSSSSSGSFSQAFSFLKSSEFYSPPPPPPPRGTLYCHPSLPLLNTRDAGLDDSDEFGLLAQAASG